MDVIQVADLRKSYGKTEVLCGISFQVRRGEIFGILGTNGAGKTTTLECMEGFRKYDGGRIQLNDDITVTLTLETNIGLFGEFASFPITLRSQATGKSEVYWK